MSIATWKKEFCPTKANTIKTVLGAVKHSLRKWKGLRKANLKKHKITNDPWRLVDHTGRTFRIDSSNCALCAVCLVCEFCPLEKVVPGACSGKGAWGFWCYGGDPEPMIKALEKTLKTLQKGGLNL